MSSAMTHETTTSELTEVESDGSSCGERDMTKKRHHGDGDGSGGGGGGGGGQKKRRKQTTPVRFSSSLVMPGTNEESNEDDEEEDEDSEGKLSSRSPLPAHPSSKDENLNNEFRCRYCGLFFDTKESLNAHHDSEHAAANQLSQFALSRSPGATIKTEPAQQQPDHTENPVNLLSVKNFANSWLAGGGVGVGVGQHVQSHTQMQTQSEDSWHGQAANQITSMSNHLQALSAFPGALAQYLPLPGFPLNDPTHAVRPSLGPAPVRIFNPDAYCDLCNKEFCNKYFLKTHKANKHGIYVDSPGPSGPQDTGVPGGLFPAGFAGNPVKLEPPATPPAPTFGCDLCQKRFKNEDSLRKHRQKMHAELLEQTDAQICAPQSEDDRETPRDSPGAMETLFKQEFGVEQEDTSFMPAPRHLSPQSMQQARDSGFSVDRLRRLGVINPEAFCEICCKEYCNKYFLRTHKMKRHGIVMQENEKSPGNSGAPVSWHQVQTSPLNLIVAETSASSESNERSVEECECKQCGLKFQTAGLYQAHYRKMHEAEEQKSPRAEFDAEPQDQRGDSISEDLQKLQTMILQLNGLEAGKGTNCAVCGKECESRSALQAHMAAEHGSAMPEDAIPSPPGKSSPTNNAAVAFCTLCEKEYPSQDALRRHIAEDHQPPVPSTPAAPLPTPAAPQAAAASASSRISTPTSQNTGERKIAPVTPTSSYCEICNKELCNKYFMKTHMQRMHGIEIENGAQIGGVICNICNKELCSKYFLRVHKHNTHGIVDENTTSSIKQESYDSGTNPEDAALKPEQLGDLSHRYFSHFTEVCPICSRRFRSIKWLKAHLMGDHGKAGIDKWREMEQQYQASSRSASRTAGASRNSQQTTNLKIPNGFDASQPFKAAEYAGLGNQVLSNLFGSSSEDQQLKNYRCSYCNFTTTVLPFLFLHERSHVSPHESADSDKSVLQCPICAQAFHQPELLHQHLLTRHQFPALLSHFPAPVLAASRAESEKSIETKDQEARDDRTGGSSPKVINANQAGHEAARNHQRQEENAVQVTAQGAYKCAQCGYATTNLTRIKKHVRKDHRSIGDPTESVIAELSKTLKDVANRHKVPACYATPQDMNSNPDKTIMQPFLIEEHDTLPAGEESSSEKRFAPALVYLPVKSRISSALTASFTLSPA